MNENEKIKTEEKKGEKIYYKETRSNNTVAIVVVAIVSSIIGGLITYGLLGNKIEKSPESKTDISGSSVTKYEISSVENPVVAIAETAGPAIVGVRVNYVSSGIFGALQEADEEGSGIIYTEDGYIITNYHVIESAINNSTATVTVTFANSDKEYEASIVGGDETTDLAVIKIDATGLTKANIGKSSELKVGELVVAIGNPLGQEFAGSVTVGYTSALNRKITTDGRTYKLIQTDAAINPGNSGGALVNSKGEVIGINTVKISSSDTEGLGFAIPTDDAMPIISELISNGKIVRPYIGISGLNIDDTTARINNLVKGVYVAQVVNNSPAASSGIQRGDIIVGIEGKSITTMEELNEVKNTKKIGDEVTLKINRAGKEMDVKVKLDSDQNAK